VIHALRCENKGQRICITPLATRTSRNQYPQALRRRRATLLLVAPSPDPAPSSSTYWGRHLRTSHWQPWSLRSSSPRRPYQPYNTTTTVAFQTPARPRAPARPRSHCCRRPRWRRRCRARSPREAPFDGAACRIKPTKRHHSSSNAPAVTPPSGPEPRSHHRPHSTPTVLRRAEPRAPSLSRARLPPNARGREPHHTPALWASA